MRGREKSRANYKNERVRKEPSASFDRLPLLTIKFY